MASGELADLNRLRNPDIPVAIQADLLLPLDELVTVENTPNIAQWKGAWELRRDIMSNKTGKLFTLTMDLSDNRDLRGRQWYGNYVIWEAFKKSGGKVPTNADELLQLYKAMQDAQPKSDDGRKAYAISADPSFQTVNATGLADGMGPNFGLAPGTSGYLMQYNGNTKQYESIFSPNSIYIQSLKWFYKANQLGILDPESPTQTNATLVGKVRDGRVLTLPWGWAAEIRNPMPVVKQNPMQGFMPIWLKGQGYPGEPTQRLVGNDVGIGIGKKSQYAKRIIKLLDFLYSTEGMYASMGEEGDLWRFNANNKAEFTPKALEDLQGGGKLSLAFTRFNGFLNDKQIDPKTGEGIFYPQWSSYRQLQENNPRDKDWQQFMGSPDGGSYLKDNLKVSHYPDEISYLSPLPDDINTIVQTVGPIVIKDSWKAVFAKNEAEFNSYIDDMTKKANGAGIEKYNTFFIADIERAKKFIEQYNHK